MAKTISWGRWDLGQEAGISVDLDAVNVNALSVEYFRFIRGCTK